MFWMRNKEINFPMSTLIWRSVDYSFWFDTINLGWSILYEGSQLLICIIYYKIAFLSLKIVFVWGVTSSIQAWSHTFVEVDLEIDSTVILLPSAESFKKGCCQLQAKVNVQSTG